MNDVTLYRGYKIIITPDDCDESPREWDNAGTMVCFHKRYNLGDKTDYRSDDYSSWAEVAEAIRKQEGKLIIFPLYLYDHSGITIKIGSFQGHLSQGHAEFDSGQVGFIYMSYKKMLSEFQVKRVTKRVLKRAEALLRGEVKVYDQYLTGDVWYFRVERNEEIIDSCGGCYDYDNTLQEAKSIVDHNIQAVRKAHAVKLKGQIKNKVALQYRGAVPV